MTHFFRNPEIQKSIFFHLLITAAATAAGFLCAVTNRTVPLSYEGSILYGLFVFALCLLFTIWHIFFTYRRYQSLAGLSLQIDTLLHTEQAVRFEDYQEGELAILSDEIAKMTLRLREQREALHQDKRYLADSIADISHQIRTPLTSMHIVLSLLSKQGLTPQRQQDLCLELNRLCSRIDWLIEALLKISRLDAGTVTMQREKVLVSALLQKASAPLEIPMELRNQRLVISGKTGNEAFLGDFSWSVEALSNVLKNCMEHTKTDGEIHVSTSENAIYTEIIIEDNGPGFAKEDLPHLFERFYKGKNSGKDSIGIGLALSRMILSRQNGTIKAENREPNGARFVIRIYADMQSSQDSFGNYL